MVYDCPCFKPGQQYPWWCEINSLRQILSEELPKVATITEIAKCQRLRIEAIGHRHVKRQARKKDGSTGAKPAVRFESHRQIQLHAPNRGGAH